MTTFLRSRSPLSPALAALILAGLLWGLTVPLSKVALGWLDGGQLTLVRFGLAAPVLAILGRGRLREAAKPAVLRSGAAGYGAVVMLQNLGIERTSVSHGALIVGAVPAIVALIVTLRGAQRRRRARSGGAAVGGRAWAGFALALAGIGLVAGGGGGDASLAGDALVLASVLLSSLFVVAQPTLLRGRDPVAVTAVQMAAGALLALPTAAASGLPHAPASLTPVLALVALLGFGTLAPYALFAYGQSQVAPQLAGVFLNLEPLVGTAAGALAFGDPFGSPQLAGAAVILLGIALSSSPARPRPRAAEPVTGSHALPVAERVMTSV